MSDDERTPAPMEGFVFLGPGADFRADERPDVDGAVRHLRELTSTIEELIDDGETLSYDDKHALEGAWKQAMEAWACLEQIWDGEGLVRG